MTTEKVKRQLERVFAVLGLIWVINILFHLISPWAYMAWYAQCDNLVLQFGGSLNGRVSMIWHLAFNLVPAILILFVGLRVQPVIARAIRKARA